ncbi:8420_t:CDS:2, partial [Ambispora gerdemannii]
SHGGNVKFLKFSEWEDVGKQYLLKDFHEAAGNFVGKAVRLTSSYRYCQVYCECASLALSQSTVKGRKNQRAAIHKYITEGIILLHSGITSTHLSTTTNDEWQSFIAQAFSMLAGERMAEKLQFTKDGKQGSTIRTNTNAIDNVDTGIENTDINMVDDVATDIENTDINVVEIPPPQILTQIQLKPPNIHLNLDPASQVNSQEESHNTKDT